MERIEEEIPNLELPNQQTKYQQVVEEMKKLIAVILEEMKHCPTNDLVFTLFETVDFYSLKRNFKFKLKSPSKDKNSINQFKNSFLTNLSNFDSFIVIPLNNSSTPVSNSNKGQKFNSPKVFDINGDEVFLSNGSTEIILFIYDNIDDLDTFIQKNYNTRLTCFCLGINVYFFEVKKWIKNNNLLTKNNNILFYFSDLSTNRSDKLNNSSLLESDSNLKLSNLPRIVWIDSNNIIKENKSIKNILYFDIKRDLIRKNNRDDDDENDTNFIYLENNQKRKIVKAINVYLKQANLKGAHFYVKSKISIDKNGIRKMKCYPAFFGEATREEMCMVNNLVNYLNKQDLFKNVENKVNYDFIK